MSDTASSYNVVENTIEVDSDFDMIKLHGSPLLDEIKKGDSVKSVTIRWYDKQIRLTKTTLAASYTAGSGKLTVTDVSNLKASSTIQVGNSYYGVISSNPSTNELTIEVLADDANHTSGDIIYFLGNADKEKAVFHDGKYVPKLSRENICQIWSEGASITDTEDEHATSGGDGNSVIVDEIEETLDELKNRQAQAIWKNRKINPSDDSGRRTGGVDYFINTYGYVPAPAAFSDDNIDAFLLYMETVLGHRVTELWMTPATIKKFSDMNKDKIVKAGNDTTAGGKVTHYISAYGYQVELKTDIYANEKKLYAFKPDWLSLHPFGKQSWKSELTSRTGTFKLYDIRGQYVLKFKKSNRCGIFEII